MQYLVVVTTKQELVDNPPAEMKDLLEEEQSRGRALYGSGDLRQSWEISGDLPGVVCLYEATSREHLQEMLDSYPFLQRGYSNTLVHLLKPDSAYTVGD